MSDPTRSHTECGAQQLKWRGVSKRRLNHPASPTVELRSDEKQLESNDPLCAHGVSLFASCETCALEPLAETNHGDQS